MVKEDLFKSQLIELTNLLKPNGKILNFLSDDYK